MNDDQKELFIKLTHFLGQVLGKNYEVVFHIISKEGSCIAAIANNHISGRSQNSPLTDLASKLVQEKAYLKQDFLCDYKASTKYNTLLRGSTFFIKQKDKLVGILCINHDTTELRAAVHKIIELENLKGFDDFLPLCEKQDQHDALASSESLSESIEDILAQNIDLKLLNSGFALTSTQKNEIICKLYKKGIFNIKGAISIVAKLLKISEPSVYRYLNKLKKL
ncbi:DNA-binding protein [Campylobacter sp. MIT 12-8780]|uniref:helix-turn-helix transcriptional regulator n=1 Tax=Campylobacter sp. MIT 12-8780 TaxID=2202200 RepID=UPI00115F598D|nr:PAS domain-containing protein [Campylobacter sp. MIT 12-8780]TQR41223.1 DNA-binding protein [Campylobacter sp. MIT 12-8780]